MADHGLLITGLLKARRERVSVSHPDPEPDFLLTIIFADEGEKTRMIRRMHFASTEHGQQVKPFVTEANEQNLEAELTDMVDAEAVDAGMTGD